jgi:hypothetical protein
VTLHKDGKACHGQHSSLLDLLVSYKDKCCYFDPRTANSLINLI